MPTFESIIWLLVALIIVGFALGALRVVGYEYYNAVMWHNLRVKVQHLRQDQDRRMRSLMRDDPPPPSTAPAPAAAEPTEAVEVEMGEAA